KIRNCSTEMGRRQRSNRAADVMGSDWNGLTIGELRNLASCCQASYFLQVGCGDPDSVGLKEPAKSFKQEEVLPSSHGDMDLGTHRPQRFHAVRGHRVFQPQ